MSLTLHYHPLSSYCHKVLMALYENGTSFEKRLVNLMDEASRAEYRKLWPIGKMPLLRDEGRDKTVVETSIIIEYLARHHPGSARLIPNDPELSRETRFADRFFDLYVNDAAAKIVTDRLRPAGQSDAFGVAEAKKTLETAYGLIDERMADQTWAIGDGFTMADCAAAPALFYAGKVHPFGNHMVTAAYLERLMTRPSYARVLAESEPYFKLFPQG